MNRQSDTSLMKSHLGNINILIATSLYSSPVVLISDLSSRRTIAATTTPSSNQEKLHFYRVTLSDGEVCSLQ